MRAILTYHSIDPSGSPISIDARAFQRHVDFLACGRVRVVPLREILAPGPGDAVAITFDDGLANFAAEAWPRLRERGLPATQFVVTGRVGRDNAWQGRHDARVPSLPLMDWDALGRLAEEGLELGAHSRTHPHLDGASDALLEDEVEGSAQDLERFTGIRPASFCYPYGSLDERAARRVARSFAAACTTRLALLEDGADRHRLPRLDAYYFRGAAGLEAWGRPLFRPRIHALRMARALRAGLRGLATSSRS